MYPSTVFLPLSQCPVNKVLKNLGFVWVLILVVSQKPGVGDNRVLTRWIGDKAIKSSAGNSTAQGSKLTLASGQCNYQIYFPKQL